MHIKTLIYFLCISTTVHTANFTIMLDPSGDAKHTGRTIDNTFERGISLECAETLKQEITNYFPDTRVILTRVPGETLQPLQNASFANRLNIDLYLSLYFYEEQETSQRVTLYYYLNNKTTDFWHVPEQLFFYPAHQAYLLNLQTTKKLGERFLSILKNPNDIPFFKVNGLFGIPFKPLIGITAPALCLEIGLQNIKDWNYIINPIIHFIEHAQNEL